MASLVVVVASDLFRSDELLLLGRVTVKAPLLLQRDGCSDALKINICSPSSVA